MCPCPIPGPAVPDPAVAAGHSTGGWWARSDPRRAFRLQLACITAGAFFLRLAYLWFSRRGTCGAEILIPGCPGDAWVYHNSANLLADGKGFISPVDYAVSGGAVRFPSADHPPLLFVLLAGFSFVGLQGWFVHQVVVVVIGTASVVVAGLMGREVFGPRVGRVAAVVVAVNPNVWINDGNVLAESLTILLVLVAIWSAYRLWACPGLARAAVLGAVIGAAMLTRPETGMLLVLLAAPITLTLRALSVRDRVVRIAVVVLVALAVTSPWVAYNLSRFNHPVLLSTGLGITLANTNCDLTYYGEHLGYWSPECIPPVPRAPGLDQSDDERFLRERALDYIGSHTRRFPIVVAARLGRMWNLYQPFQQARLDYYEGRPVWASHLALGFFYPLLVMAGYGAMAVRRRGIPVSPLVAPVLMVVISAVITFGHARYRAPAEGAICILAAVAIDALWTRSRRVGPGEGEARPELVTAA